MPFINEVIASNIETIAHESTKDSVRFVSRYRFDVEQAIAFLKANIIGQAHAITAIEQTLYRIKADIHEPNKPLAVCLLFGPTGVGKTQLVHLLSQILLGNPNAICRIDMNTLNQSHYSAALSGAPPGYAGSKENHTLFNTEAITGNYSQPGIVLFDEIEKASKDVLRSLLAVLDHGQMTLANGEKTIDFSNSIIFMTSNLGSQSLLDKNCIPFIRAKYAQKQKSKALTHIASHFDPEFFNRIEQFIEFRALEKNEINGLIDLEIKKLNKRIKRHNCAIQLHMSARHQLAKQYNRIYGARNLHHLVRSQIDTILAKALVHGLVGSKIEIRFSENKFSLLPPSTQN